MLQHIESASYENIYSKVNAQFDKDLCNFLVSLIVKKLAKYHKDDINSKN